MFDLDFLKNMIPVNTPSIAGFTFGVDLPDTRESRKKVAQYIRYQYPNIEDIEEISTSNKRDFMCDCENVKRQGWASRILS
jgi:hypothetical protein